MNKNKPGGNGNDANTNQTRLDKIIAFLKSLKGKKPDYENLDFSTWNQTEEDYQKEQKSWIEKIRKKKKQR